MDKVVIIGMGGHARSLIDTIERQGLYEIAGYTDFSPSQEALGKVYLGTDEQLETIFASGIKNAAIGIGFLGKENARKRKYEQLKELGFFLPTIIDPSAIVSKYCQLGNGNFIGKEAIINAGAIVGDNCIINTKALIEHDCKVEDNSHVAVGAVLCGGVRIGYSSFVGANSTVIQERVVGNECIVGAGSVLKRNLSDGEVFV